MSDLITYDTAENAMLMLQAFENNCEQQGYQETYTSMWARLCAHRKQRVGIAQLRYDIIEMADKISEETRFLERSGFFWDEWDVDVLPAILESIASKYHEWPTDIEWVVNEKLKEIANVPV